jgi:hypothetical protein
MFDIEAHAQKRRKEDQEKCSKNFITCILCSIICFLIVWLLCLIIIMIYNFTNNYDGNSKIILDYENYSGSGD